MESAGSRRDLIDDWIIASSDPEEIIWHSNALGQPCTV